jgi:hypothetical protein
LVKQKPNTKVFTQTLSTSKNFPKTNLKTLTKQYNSALKIPGQRQQQTAIPDNHETEEISPYSRIKTDTTKKIQTNKSFTFFTS